MPRSFRVPWTGLSPATLHKCTPNPAHSSAPWAVAKSLWLLRCAARSSCLARFFAGVGAIYETGSCQVRLLAHLSCSGEQAALQSLRQRTGLSHHLQPDSLEVEVPEVEHKPAHRAGAVGLLN